MNTKTFNTMNEEMLAQVEGGKFTGTDCVKVVSVGAITGATTGFASGVPTLGLTSIPAAFVGAHIGAIGGGIVCVGGMLGN